MRTFILFILAAFVTLGGVLYFFPSPFLVPVANLLIVDDDLQHADGVVVLNTGVEIYDRLIEAAKIYGDGLADKVILDGNRKTESVKKLEAMGYEPCCSWDEGRIRVLELYGVQREDIISISAPDAYDTVSEAAQVANTLHRLGMKRLIIATSKTHTARAIYIWRANHGQQFSLQSAAASTDEFNPNSWWQDGKQIRWILHEYGSWLYYYWKKLI